MNNEKRILLVEDDTFVVDIYETKLSNEGYNVQSVSNGKDALEHIQKEKPNLILLDIMMPYMDGMEVLKELKANDEWKDIPVVMLTNLSEKDNIKKALDMGANDYLIKSHFTPSEILKKIEALLQQK